MKKNLLTLMSLVALTSQSFAQETYVTGNVNVKVMPGTMFYNGENLNIMAGTTAVVTNDGNIYIPNGKLNNAATNPQDRFVLTHTGAGNSTTYGQLITDGTKTNTGKITIQKTLPSTAGAIQSAIPFSGYTLQDWATNFSINVSDICTSPANCKGALRSKHPMFRWNNTDLRWDPVLINDIIDPTGYYYINNNLPGLTGTDYSGSSSNKSFVGTPNTSTSSFLIPNSRIGAAVSFGNAGDGYNVYGVRYRTYIDDYISTPKWSADYGRNQVQLSNPYPSNIDLSYIGFNEPAKFPNDGNSLTGLLGVWHYSTSRHVGGLQDSDFGGVAVVAAETNPANGQFVLGDVNSLIIRPFAQFILKGNNNFPGQTFFFTDNLKTFKNTSKAADYGVDGSGGGAYQNFSTTVDSPVYQIQLALSDEIGETGNLNYTAVGDALESGQTTDVKNLWVDQLAGFYGLPESLAGGLDENQAGIKLYINKVSSDFIGKAIPLGFRTTIVDGNNRPIQKPVYTGKYTIKSNLFDNGRLLSKSEKKFANPNAKFIFHDKEAGVYKEVTTDFSYEFTQTTDTENRFELFYGDIENLGTENPGLGVLSSKTIVYKNTSDTNYYVKFASDWKKASVKVYTLAGQLTHTSKSIDADVDYLLPLKSGVYLVNIQNDENGQIVTQKVIK